MVLRARSRCPRRRREFRDRTARSWRNGSVIIEDHSTYGFVNENVAGKMVLTVEIGRVSARRA
jgi:hypothetical protein